MKTLIISVDYPLPEDKGNRMRTMHFVRCFREYGDVDLMCYMSHVPKQAMITPFRKEYHIELNMEKDGNPTNTLKRIRDKLIECNPWIVNNFTASTVKYIHNIILNEDYDIILCRYSVNAYPLLSLPEKYKKRVILDIDDLMSGDLYDAINGEKKGLKRIKTFVDKMVFKRYQMKCLELGKVLFCSEADRSKMVKYSNATNMYVVPNIIPKQTMPGNYNRDGYDNRYLLFVGALSYMPNEMGIMWFIREIFEKLPIEFQDIKLLVAGKDPQDKLRELCSQNNKIVLVENPLDVIPYFEKCLAVVVPVLVGGGTRIKILEAGNCYRPVISTSLGAYGLGLKEYENVLYFDNYKSFIKKLLWLKDKTNYMSIVDNLKNTVETKYTEKNFVYCVKKIIISC